MHFTQIFTKHLDNNNSANIEATIAPKVAMESLEPKDKYGLGVRQVYGPYMYGILPYRPYIAVHQNGRTFRALLLLAHFKSINRCYAHN